ERPNGDDRRGPRRRAQESQARGGARDVQGAPSQGLISGRFSFSPGTDRAGRGRIDRRDVGASASTAPRGHERRTRGDSGRVGKDGAETRVARLCPPCAGQRVDGMKRRQFITLFAGAAAMPSVFSPRAARAQQPAKLPRIGIIDDSPKWNVFRHALRELGHLEGESIAFDYAYGDGAPERLAEAAAQLVRRPVDVIATYGTAPTFPAMPATITIPIVMISVGDPVRAGLVASLARPGGNVTGNTILGP